jgi:hypothetical protein
MKSRCDFCGTLVARVIEDDCPWHPNTILSLCERCFNLRTHYYGGRVREISSLTFIGLRLQTSSATAEDGMNFRTECAENGMFNSDASYKEACYLAFATTCPRTQTGPGDGWLSPRF